VDLTAAQRRARTIQTKRQNTRKTLTAAQKRLYRLYRGNVPVKLNGITESNTRTAAGPQQNVYGVCLQRLHGVVLMTSGRGGDKIIIITIILLLLLLLLLFCRTRRRPASRGPLRARGAFLHCSEIVYREARRRRRRLVSSR